MLLLAHLSPSLCHSSHNSTHSSHNSTHFPFFLADWVDTKDPNVIAESELLQAAASIEAAAKKLAELKPREKAVSHLMSHDREMNECREFFGGDWQKFCCRTIIYFVGVGKGESLIWTFREEDNFST